ncbi:MAG: DNA-binding response regulator, partial [Bacteroidetes bacterium]
MLRILIIEDEPPAARRLERMLRLILPEADILPALDSVKGAVAWLKEQKADLLLLDIHLADGNSFSIFEQIDVRTPIIFTTAYDQYALRAFKLNSIDYLLKPIEREELERAIAKFAENRHPENPQPDLQQLLKSLQPQPVKEYKKRFMVSSGDKLRSVTVEEVAYFYGQQKYVFLITKDKRRHLVDYTLGELEDLLDPNTFFRINRQFLIRVDAITAMTH